MTVHTAKAGIAVCLNRIDVMERSDAHHACEAVPPPPPLRAGAPRLHLPGSPLGGPSAARDGRRRATGMYSWHALRRGTRGGGAWTVRRPCTAQTGPGVPGLPGDSTPPLTPLTRGEMVVDSSRHFIAFEGG